MEWWLLIPMRLGVVVLNDNTPITSAELTVQDALIKALAKQSEVATSTYSQYHSLIIVLHCWAKTKGVTTYQ
jgi:hypothetical protein